MEKLVRDKIPSIIGKSAVFYICDDYEYQSRLIEKLKEEVMELILAKGKDEISSEAADLVEVIQAYCATAGVSWDDIMVAKAIKTIDRGGFEDRIVLTVNDK